MRRGYAVISSLSVVVGLGSVAWVAAQPAGRAASAPVATVPGMPPVPDARNLYSEARLQSTLDSLRDRALPELVHEVMQDVERFAGGAPQSDDIAMLVIRYQGSDSSPEA